jgi:hypothetical protein
MQANNRKFDLITDTSHGQFCFNFVEHSQRSPHVPTTRPSIPEVAVERVTFNFSTLSKHIVVVSFIKKDDKVKHRKSTSTVRNCAFKTVHANYITNMCHFITGVSYILLKELYLT